MDALLSFFAENRTGLLVFFLSLAGLALIIQWFAWIFSLGRFKANRTKTAVTTARSSLRFIAADLLVKIIDDFRHLLALIIVLIFAIALGVAMYIGSASIDNLTKSMQVVVATLGGLVGSIIGYYFGESSVKQQNPNPAQTTTATSAEQEEIETPSAAADITPAPLPPSTSSAVDNPDANGNDTT